MLNILIVEDDSQLAVTLKYLVEDNPRYRVVAMAAEAESAIVAAEEHEPDLVVLPRTTAQVQAVVRLANEAGMPIVARGAGTGLCSGAVPLRGGIVVSLTRMNRVLEVDYANRTATVEPHRVETV